MLGLFTTYTQQTGRESVKEAHLLLQSLGRALTTCHLCPILLAGTSIMERQSSWVSRKNQRFGEELA